MATEANNGIVQGTPAPDFALPDCNPLTSPTPGIVTRDGIVGEAGLLVMFICNHCPYVIAIRERLVEDCRELMAVGFGVVAISANDVTSHPQDGPEHMAEVAREAGFPFPYLYDESQVVARAYGAVCTPDFFGFDADLRLRYRGRLDAGGRGP
ncbi:MAG: thioredoxin family protein, partial [Rhodocyclaceae bacterium]|nr:thioredoxin family protein [Rhodocyclaceae bacterium]